jgi:methionyl-tRNA synthetase
LIKFVNSKYNGVIPDFKTESLGSDYYQNSLESDINRLLTNYVNALEGQNLRLGLEIAMHISTRGNLFLQENKLDNSLFANFPEKSDAVIAVGLNIIYLLSALLYPYIPETTQGILDQLCAPQRSIPDKFDLALLPGHNIGKAKYLFKRIDEAKIDEWKAKYGGIQQK